MSDTKPYQIPPDAAAAWASRLLRASYDIDARGPRPVLEQLVRDLARAGLVPTIQALTDAQKEVEHFAGLCRQHGVIPAPASEDTAMLDLEIQVAVGSNGTWCANALNEAGGVDSDADRRFASDAVDADDIVFHRVRARVPAYPAPHTAIGILDPVEPDV